MKGILIQQKCLNLDGKYAENVSDDKKRDNDEYAYSSIILNLSDSVIRKVGKQNSAKELWDRLEELFTETSLPSKLFLLEKFFRYKLDMSKNIDENIDEFTKLVQDIKLTGDKNIDDYTPIVLLNAIPDVYSDVKAAIKYGRDNVCLDTVINGLKSKEMDIKTNKTSSQSNNEVNMHKVQFPASQNPNPVSSSSILDYVHADVWGPSNVSTHGGNKYFLSIIDNFSRKVFVFLMKHKSDVFENFRKWKILVENQTGKKLKVLRTDNGLEFCNQSFSNLCDECGIKRHKTNPYTPQQNGVAERMNRTLLEKVRCMLISSGLPKSFWGETLVTAAYLINRSPSVPLNGKIPESVWTGHAVDISSLRVFGCSAFVHQSVDKLAPRSQKCVFIGYPDGIKGYRLWLRSQPGFKVLISKDVIFNENEMPCLDDSQDKNNDNLDLTFNKVEDNQQGEENEEEPGTDFLENSNSEGLDDYLLARDRNRREPRIPARYNDFHIALNVEPNEPSSVEEALKSENSKNWLSAMAEEMKSLKDNNTWVLVPKPKSCSVVDCKWIFKIKEEDTSKRFKARLVAKGFTQKEGIDYTEIFSPVVKYTTVRIILALTAHFNWS
ncbi:UNVERIFIED_CONTAM: Retrovirus-related Pol polyprotein from transposon TNT 1-94 [Sesamum angustifolium]|uniref:Retrovirus-related Pol polyprotein from transposon TNT 1-94 n=1 Tax=Sesamum angustifolium TaxID=2727405 RepID=A0AAW2IZQ4_9LAMI